MKALDRVTIQPQHASLQLRSILLLARTMSWLFPDGQTAGCESTFTLEHLGIAVSDVMCILCAENGQELHDGLQGAWAIKKERKKKKKHIESKPLFKQNCTNNRPQQMVKLGFEPHPLNHYVKNTIPLIGWHSRLLRSNVSSHALRTMSTLPTVRNRKSLCYSYQSQCNKDTSASITGYGWYW